MHTHTTQRKHLHLSTKSRALQVARLVCFFFTLSIRVFSNVCSFASSPKRLVWQRLHPSVAQNLCPNNTFKHSAHLGTKAALSPLVATKRREDNPHKPLGEKP
jgi:hypothetical protein